MVWSTRSKAFLKSKNRAIGVPLELKGLWEFHSRHGSVPLATLVMVVMMMMVVVVVVVVIMMMMMTMTMTTTTMSP